MKWHPQAERALLGVPALVRPLARKSIEQQVKSSGRQLVTAEDYQSAYDRFRRAIPRDQSKLKDVLPAVQADSPEMVLIETCHAELRQCPHKLIPVSEWASRLEAALQEINFSERLLERVEGEQVLLHHKFRISISGCPNCCSQPQIKDFGVHGQAAPEYLGGCTACGECAKACPDSCIVVTDYPQIDRDVCLNCGDCIRACPVPECLVSGQGDARLMAGGKLGRRPHLAETLMDFATMDDAERVVVEMAQSYLAQSSPGERVSDWLVRTGWRPAL